MRKAMIGWGLIRCDYWLRDCSLSSGLVLLAWLGYGKSSLNESSFDADLYYRPSGIV